MKLRRLIRYPVQTYVLEKNDSVIRDAVLREMERGGQVYYLYNKVDTIDQKVSEITGVDSRCFDWLCSWANE